MKMPWEITESASRPKEPAKPVSIKKPPPYAETIAFLRNAPPPGEYSKQMTAARQTARALGIPVDDRAPHDRKGRQLWNRRLRLYHIQGGLCFWCAKPMSLEAHKIGFNGRPKDNPSYATFEHLIPVYRGGIRGAMNIVMAHGWCNNKRPRKKWPHDPVYGEGKPPIIPMNWNAEVDGPVAEPAEFVCS